MAGSFFLFVIWWGVLPGIITIVGSLSPLTSLTQSPIWTIAVPLKYCLSYRLYDFKVVTKARVMVFSLKVPKDDVMLSFLVPMKWQKSSFMQCHKSLLNHSWEFSIFNLKWWVFEWTYDKCWVAHRMHSTTVISHWLPVKRSWSVKHFFLNSCFWVEILMLDGSIIQTHLLS